MENFCAPEFKLGVLGGGQLGRMLIEAGGPLNIHFSVLDPAKDAPCALVAHDFMAGRFDDHDTVLQFGTDKSVVTVEIEHVSVSGLRALAKLGVRVFPNPDILEIVQDKGLQKQFFKQHNIPTSDYELFDTGTEALQKWGRPCVLKLRKGGYDGRGVMVINGDQRVSPGFEAPVVAEEKVDIEKELSVIVARNTHGEISAFPSVEMYFNKEANLVELLFSPAHLSPQMEQQARNMAIQTARAFDLTGVMAVEMFLTRGGELLVNEVAPRPHNSGHHTIEANYTSQYQQHLRAILGMPLGDTQMRTPAAMVNILGEPEYSGPVKYLGIDQALAKTGVYLHLYGKSHTKPFRKMGHLTALGVSAAEACETANAAVSKIRVVAQSI